MPMKVRKAVFPAAGLGTRFLPATKAQPKEMLPLVDKPIIQYGVEEAMMAGCDQIIIITGRGKQAIEDHFDVSYELEKMLEERKKLDLLKIVRDISDMLSEMFGMEWWKVHDEAERLEHAVSPDFELKLLSKLGRGGACPHGNLSELESPASRRRRGLSILANAEPGKSYAVSGIYERDRRLLEFLESRGIRPGAHIEVLHANYDDTLTLKTDVGQVSLGAAAAGKIWVSLHRRPSRQ